MEKAIKFLGLRGFVMTTNQLSLFNYEIDTSEKKNIEFRRVFETLLQNKKIQIVYLNRPYYLYFVKKHNDDIVQCKLCRKVKLKKHDLGESDINEQDIDDYPYINIFVHMASQKFLVEINQSVFADYFTPKIILEKVMNSVLKSSECFMDIKPIINDKSFWNYIENSSMIYEVEFSLNAPNLFDVNDDADSFVKAVEQTTNAKNVSVKLTNSEGQLDIKKENVDTYVKFANAGGGEWSIKRKSKDGTRATTIKSSKRAKTINIIKPKTEINAGNISVNIIINSFNNIETIENFKIGDSE